MAIKKRTSLRSKAAKRDPKVVVKKREPSKALLDKLAGKKEANVPSAVLDPHQEGISKSAVRRRKRKLRQRLTAKLEDLQGELEQVEKKDSEEGEVSEAVTKKKLDHTPNPRTKRGAMAMERQESKRFQAVLKEKTFRENPFASLKEAILREQ